MTNNRKKILVFGATGLVGSAVMRSELSEDYDLVSDREWGRPDLTDRGIVSGLISAISPDVIVVAAAKVGGIMANKTYPAEFIYTNLAIETTIIEEARIQGVRKLIFLGSSCIYPRECKQPIKEEYLLSGPLEETNRPYAVAKIAGIELCDSYRRQYGCDFVSLMPTNLYGPKDNYNLENSHVLPAMIRKFHEAKLAGEASVTMWGTGEVMREFLHVDDLASAITHVIRENLSWQGPMNVGTGLDVQIKHLAQAIAKIVGFEGELHWDTSRPDGTPRKLLDVSMIQNTGWSHKIYLVDGIESLYADLCKKPVEEWKQ